MPDVPTNLQAFGTFSHVILSWDTPQYNGHQYTRIYRSDTDNLAGAVAIATSIASVYADDTGPLGDGAGYYYWITHVNLNDVESAHHPAINGVYAETSLDPDIALSKLTQMVNSGQLSEYLRGDIEWVINKYATLEALFNDGTGIIERVGNAEGTISNHNGMIFANEENLAAMGIATFGLEDSITLARTDAASWDGVLVAEINSLKAVVYEIDGITPKWQAGVNDIKAAFAYDNGAIAISAQDVYVDQGNGPEGIQTYVEARAGEADSTVAQWAVKSSVASVLDPTDKLVGGIGLWNDGQQVYFTVSANRFAVINPLDNTAEPLLTVVQNSGDPDVPDGVYIPDAYIRTAHIKNLIAQTVVADFIHALELTAVDITGGTIGIGGDAFTVDENGQVEARNITIKNDLGEIVLQVNDVGAYISGAFIENLTVGTLDIVNGAVTATRFFESPTYGPTTSAVTLYDDTISIGSDAFLTVCATVEVKRSGDTTTAYDSVKFIIWLYDDTALVKTISHTELYADAKGTEQPKFLMPVSVAAPITSGSARLKISAQTDGSPVQPFFFKVTGFSISAKR
ncbi:hypothetical protein ACFQMB_14355 [Pseudobowmanella zhangzhouensis]|uniref:phage tail tip fiber protein n=1 Tax=Pseudobowmanella zhangzhouensis TaxID=1537679 RepID=UPI0036120C89